MLINHTGNFAINMDAKGRMAVPARARELLAEACDGRIVITAHQAEPCLAIYPEPSWQELLPQLQQLPSGSKAVRQLQRRVIGHAVSLELDGNGRVLLPPTLREFAGLEKKLMLVGVGNKYELWSEAAWNEQMQAGVDDELPDAALELSL